MDFWNNSSTLVKVIIITAAVFGVIVIIAACLSLFALLTGTGPAETAPEGSTVIVKGVVIVVPTPAPSAPAVIAIENVNIRSGPGTEYNVIGTLLKGHRAEAVGVNPDRTWWAIKIPGTPENTGWVSGQYVQTENVGGVPVIQPPAVPTPTATPPVVITDWMGEYFNNPDVAGEPVLVRNDTTIDFNWGSGAPAPELPTNNYSVRWSRRASFEENNYRFNMNVEGGVRLWLDGRLLIDSWVSEGLRSLQADSGVLSAGDHDLRIDYFKRTGNGQISVNWGKYEVPLPPKAVITGVTQAQVGQLVTFSAKESQPAAGSRIVRNEWDFGDGTKGTGVDVTHAYNNPNTYNVTLTVTDDKGLTDTTVHQIQISGAPVTATPAPGEPPVARIVAPSEVQVGQAVTFDGSQSSASNTIVSYAWDFGDGRTANAVSVDHVYSIANVYNVTLTVTDQGGLTNSTVHRIQVTEAPVPTPTSPPAEPPVARITAPAEGQVGQVITFDAGGSTSGNQITGYNWDFGDGTGADTVLADHIYANPGTYNVVLTIMDSAGLQDSTSVSIVIRPAAVDTPTPEPTAEPTVAPPPLEGVVWQLNNTLPGTQITAIFQSGVVSGSAGCNNYNARYQISGDSISITLNSKTNKMCDDNVMTQEGQYIAALTGAKTYEVQGNQLRIGTEVNGQPVMLVFTTTQ